MVLLAYDGFLRTGEFCAATPEDFEFLNNSFVLHLGETKGVARRGGVENYSCEDRHLAKLARRSCDTAPAVSKASAPGFQKPSRGCNYSTEASNRIL